MKKYLIVACLGVGLALVANVTADDDAWHACFGSTQAALEAGDSRTEALEAVATEHARHLAAARTKKQQLRYFEEHPEWGARDRSVALAAATFTTRVEIGEQEDLAADTGDTLGCLEDIGDGPFGD